MNIDELIDVLRGLPGRDVEVTIWLGEPENGGQWISAFSGTVDRVADSSSNPVHHWTVYWQEDPTKPHPGSITIWRDGFEGAEVKSSGRSLEEVVAEDDGSTGTTWTVLIRQMGSTLELTLYIGSASN